MGLLVIEQSADSAMVGFSPQLVMQRELPLRDSDDEDQDQLDDVRARQQENEGIGVPMVARPMPIQTNCRTIAATNAAGAPVMAAIRRQMCSVVDKRSASKALTLSIVGWRSGRGATRRPTEQSEP